MVQLRRPRVSLSSTEASGYRAAGRSPDTVAGQPRNRTGFPTPRRRHYPPAMPRSDSIVLLNTGHGKGKSSAAFGVMARGWARGWTVGVVQFIKSGKWKTGERKLADHLGVEWH